MAQAVAEICTFNSKSFFFSFRFPLFCRSIPPAESLLYAVFLLNQNILQIKFLLNVQSREDIRATLPNVLDILNAADNFTKNTIQEFCKNGSTYATPMSSISESSNDVVVPVPMQKNSVSDEHINDIKHK